MEAIHILPSQILVFFKKNCNKKKSIIQLLAIGKNRNRLAVIKIGIIEDLDCGSGYE